METLVGPELSTSKPDHLLALLADLRMLDDRLRRAIEGLRMLSADGVDPALRGLLVEEGDVDSWLVSLSAMGSAAMGDSPESGDALPWAENGRMFRVGELFGLGDFERAAMLTALAPEIDLAYSNLFAYVQDDVTKKYTTLDLVASLWCKTLADKLEARRLLNSEATLRRHLLLSVEDSGNSPASLLSRPLILDPRIASYLLGTDTPDQALTGSVEVFKPRSLSGLIHAGISDSQVSHLEQLARAALGDSTMRPGSNGHHATRRERGGLVVWMRGPEKQGKHGMAEQLAAKLGRSLLVVDSAALVLAGSDLHKSLYRALREAMLQDAIIYWSDADALGAQREMGGADLPAELAHLLGEWPGCALLDVRSAIPLHIAAGPLVVELEFPAPSNERRRWLWERALNAGTRLAEDVDLTLLTGAFRLTGAQIEAAADSARHSAAWRSAVAGMPGEPEVTMRDLLVACRSHSNQGLGALARKITPRYTWADLVLPSDRVAQLHEMCHHVRYGPIVFEQWGFDRKLAGGKGLNVLFAGQPGTGKTMASEVLATDLGLELYKIDLSSVVSKYIGETEKNLERIFREGQTSNAILFFDEADSLFGKRSQVKDSHDRYANIETSYLLQRMEEYDGIVILATNLRKNLDDAFVRRLHGAIEFPMPEEPDRLEIWRRTFPIEAPLDPNADLGFFAKRFKLSGGNIKNIVLEAAFLAAEAGTLIGMPQLIRATRREHQKIGKLISDTDFGPYAGLLRHEEPVA